jgi:hypothetical protein
LLQYDDDLWTIETEFVVAPFVVDFSGATLNRPSTVFQEFTGTDWEAWTQERKAMFGDDWGRVLTVLGEFEQLGIHLGDFKPGNITIRE